MVGLSVAPRRRPVLATIIETIPPSIGKLLIESGMDVPESSLQQLMATSPQLEGLGSLTLETVASLEHLLECAKRKETPHKDASRPHQELPIQDQNPVPYPK